MNVQVHALRRHSSWQMQTQSEERIKHYGPKRYLNTNFKEPRAPPPLPRTVNSHIAYRKR